MNKMEHITVVYFSPTGGTRKACLNLAMEMGEEGQGMWTFAAWRESIPLGRRTP
mgnify:CR=1 FL=1